jgi:hypothetical protein
VAQVLEGDVLRLFRPQQGGQPVAAMGLARFDHEVRQERAHAVRLKAGKRLRVETGLEWT